MAAMSRIGAFVALTLAMFASAVRAGACCLLMNHTIFPPTEMSGKTHSDSDSFGYFSNGVSPRRAPDRAGPWEFTSLGDTSLTSDYIGERFAAPVGVSVLAPAASPRCSFRQLAAYQTLIQNGRSAGDQISALCRVNISLRTFWLGGPETLIVSHLINRLVCRTHRGGTEGALDANVLPARLQRPRAVVAFRHG